MPIEARLEADLVKLQADRDARQADLDRENGTRDQLVASLSALNDLLGVQTDITDQLAEVIAQIQTAQNELTNQPPDVTAALAALLETQEQNLVHQSNQAAWNQAHVGVGLALVTHLLPVGTTVAEVGRTLDATTAPLTSATAPLTRSVPTSGTTAVPTASSVTSTVGAVASTVTGLVGH